MLILLSILCAMPETIKSKAYSGQALKLALQKCKVKKKTHFLSGFLRLL